MKKVNFFAMLAAAALMTGLTGCSNDDNVGEGPDNGANTLLVKLPSDNVGTGSRAVEGPVTGQPNTLFTSLDNVAVFLLNGNAIVDRKEFTPQEVIDGEKRIEQVSAAITRVIVVANVPTGVLATLQGYSSAAQLLNHAYTTASQNPASVTAGEELDGKVLVGDVPTDKTATDPDTNHDLTHSYMEAKVTLNSLTARFEVGAVDAGEGIANIELIGVWINRFYKDGSKVDADIVNEGSTSTYWDTTPDTSTGQNTPLGAVSIDNSWIAPEYFDDADNVNVTLNASSKVYAYHLFAGNNIPQLILLVKGQFETDYYEGDKEYFLGYVTFNKFLEGNAAISSVDANTIYKIGVGASGIKIDSEMITPKPNLGQIDLGIEVIVAPWTEKTVTPGV